MYPKKFEDLIQAFTKLPGVGKKTAERYAFTVLGWEEEDLDTLITSLQGVQKGIHHCSICGNLCDEDVCMICSDQSRDKDMICVVQSPKDIAAVESIEAYHGVYHVLHGAINTQKGILPDQLNIESLIKRVNNQTKEVILATDPTIEGETTALYLSKLLKNHVKVTRLAHGIPIGGHLDYTDTLTLLKAFQGRNIS